METINITGYALTYTSFNVSTYKLTASYQGNTFNEVAFDRILTSKTGLILVDSTNIIVVLEKDGTFYGIRLTKYNSDENIRALKIFDTADITSPITLENANVIANFGTSANPNTKAVAIGYSSNDWTPSQISSDFVLPIVDSNGELVGWYPNSEEAQTEVEALIANEGEGDTDTDASGDTDENTDDDSDTDENTDDDSDTDENTDTDASGDTDENTDTDASGDTDSGGNTDTDKGGGDEDTGEDTGTDEDVEEPIEQEDTSPDTDTEETIQLFTGEIPSEMQVGDEVDIKISDDVTFYTFSISSQEILVWDTSVADENRTGVLRAVGEGEVSVELIIVAGAQNQVEEYQIIVGEVETPIEELLSAEELEIYQVLIGVVSDWQIDAEKFSMLYKIAQKRAKVVFEGIECYFLPATLKLLKQNLILHYIITNEMSGELYRYYGVDSNAYLIQSASNSSSSSSMYMNSAFEKLTFLGMDLLRTPFGRFAYEILEQVNITIAVL